MCCELHLWLNCAYLLSSKCSSVNATSIKVSHIVHVNCVGGCFHYSKDLWRILPRWVERCAWLAPSIDTREVTIATNKVRQFLWDHLSAWVIASVSSQPAPIQIYILMVLFQFFKQSLHIGGVATFSSCSSLFSHLLRQDSRTGRMNIVYSQIMCLFWSWRVTVVV